MKEKKTFVSVMDIYSNLFDSIDLNNQVVASDRLELFYRLIEFNTMKLLVEIQSLFKYMVFIGCIINDSISNPKTTNPLCDLITEKEGQEVLQKYNQE